MITPFLSLPPAPARLLRRALVPAAHGLRETDLLLAGGRIQAIEPDLPPTGLAETDLGGSLVLPAFHDIHTHLDKGFIWQRQPNADGTFAAAMAAVATDRDAHWTREDIEARMDFALRCAWAHGTAAIRTHLDTFGAQRAITWSLFRDMQARWRGRIALQAVSLCMLDLYAGHEGDAIAREVAATEGGLLGGVLFHGPGNAERLDRLLALAIEYGLDLDLHVDENGIESGTALAEVAQAVLRHRFRGKVLCGHCCSLAVQPDIRERNVIARVRDAGLGIVSLPMCNMYLQDREAGRTPRWRGVTLLHELAAAGVPIMLASDNTRDPFYAYGDLDMLDVFTQGVRIAHLDHPFGSWVETVTTRPASWMGRDAALVPGAAADLVAFDAGSLNELLARPQADRIVLRAGQPIDTQPPRYRSLPRPLQSGICT